jgi:hypothetical protein
MTFPQCVWLKASLKVGPTSVKKKVQHQYCTMRERWDYQESGETKIFFYPLRSTTSLRCILSCGASPQCILLISRLFYSLKVTFLPHCGCPKSIYLPLWDSAAVKVNGCISFSSLGSHARWWAGQHVRGSWQACRKDGWTGQLAGYRLVAISPRFDFKLQTWFSL